jgi:hypothetical protein
MSLPFISPLISDISLYESAIRVGDSSRILVKIPYSTLVFWERDKETGKGERGGESDAVKKGKVCFPFRVPMRTGDKVQKKLLLSLLAFTRFW